MKASLRSLVVLLGLTALLTGCERPPMDTVQRGYRGTGMEQVANPRLVAMQIPKHLIYSDYLRSTTQTAKRD